MDILFVLVPLSVVLALVILGALGWATYFVATTADTVRSAFRTVRTPT